DRYVKSKKSLEELFGKYKNIYYYAVVNKGLFRGKEVYAINIYNEKIYAISENGLNEY
ncbi:TPA: UbiD family decarboxylase, partial [Clostridioides difficile]|nr:UbiD family decarboxylase [Clostridioides difficile]HBH0619761.1 UbiD family decarboxylase [Clostridioides difficile]